MLCCVVVKQVFGALSENFITVLLAYGESICEFAVIHDAVIFVTLDSDIIFAIPLRSK